MRIFVCYCDFKHTSGNHAGMSHLVKYLNCEIENVKIIKNVSHEFRTARYWGKLHAIWIALYLFFVLKKGDKVVFFEYLSKDTGYQHLSAEILRSLGIKNAVYGLIHLSQSHLLEIYGSEKIIALLRFLDHIIVFGSSLASFIKSVVPDKDVITTFHYVDTNYYVPSATYNGDSEILQVVCIGNIKRNFNLLRKIIEASDKTFFHICMGRSKLGTVFEGLSNVKVYGFLHETQLLEVMQSCNVSLSVIDDTVGSNVITSSLAIGLPQIVSEVGSVRDYCDEGDTLFCRSFEDYLSALTYVNKNRKILNEMRSAALKKASRFSLSGFKTVFSKFMEI